MEEDKPKPIAKVESMKKTLGGLFSNHTQKNPPNPWNFFHGNSKK